MDAGGWDERFDAYGDVPHLYLTTPVGYNARSIVPRLNELLTTSSKLKGVKSAKFTGMVKAIEWLIDSFLRSAPAIEKVAAYRMKLGVYESGVFKTDIYTKWKNMLKYPTATSVNFDNTNVISEVPKVPSLDLALDTVDLEMLNCLAKGSDDDILVGDVVNMITRFSKSKKRKVVGDIKIVMDGLRKVHRI